MGCIKQTAEPFFSSSQGPWHRRLWCATGQQGPFGVEWTERLGKSHELHGYDEFTYDAIGGGVFFLILNTSPQKQTWFTWKWGAPLEKVVFFLILNVHFQPHFWWTTPMVTHNFSGLAPDMFMFTARPETPLRDTISRLGGSTTNLWKSKKKSMPPRK